MTKKLAEEVKEPIEVKEPTKAVKNAYLEAYKLQNPEKYEAKMKSGEFKAKGLISILVAVLLCSGAVFGSVKAYQAYGDGPKVIVEGNYIEASTVAPVQDEMLGAVTSPNIESLWIAVNGDTEYHITAPFAASSTFVKFTNPFGATSVATVEKVRMQVTAAASTTAAYMDFDCGASSDGYAIPDVVAMTVDNFGAATSTGLFENNLTAALGGTLDGGTVAKIALNSTYPYFVCFASSTANYYSSSNATFNGKVTAVINRTR